MGRPVCQLALKRDPDRRGIGTLWSGLWDAGSEITRGLEPPTLVAGLDDVAMVGQSVEQRRFPSVEYAPWWVCVLSAACLGVGTMIGYRRIVSTLGERVGSTHLTPAQGASAELVGAGLIASAGFNSPPVSTTHIMT